MRDSGSSERTMKDEKSNNPWEYNGIHTLAICHINSKMNQLEKLEAARSAYLWLPFLTFRYMSWPY